MNKRFILACLLFLGCALGVQAEQYGIEIAVSDGAQPSRTLFYLDEQPQVSYDANHDLQLTTQSGVQFTLPASTGMQVHFVSMPDTPVSIALPEAEAVPTYALHGDALSLSGLRPGAVVRVFNLQGQLLSTQRIASDGLAELTLPQGICVVSVDGWKVKIKGKN